MFFFCFFFLRLRGIPGSFLPACPFWFVLGVIYSFPRWSNGYPRMLLVRCLRFTKFCWVRKHLNIIKPTNSPTQRQPNPRKNRLKVAFWPLFPTANKFSWVRIGFVLETDYKKPNPTKLSTNTLVLVLEFESRRGEILNYLQK